VTTVEVEDVETACSRPQSGRKRTRKKFLQRPNDIEKIEYDKKKIGVSSELFISLLTPVVDSPPFLDLEDDPAEGGRNKRG
jgi:hypothetical protein